MNFEFHPEALEEYQEASRYYAERDPQLARRFIQSVEDAIGRVVDTPDRWRIVDEDVRRCLSIWHLVHDRNRLRSHCRRDALQSRTRILEKPHLVFLIGVQTCCVN